MVSIINFKGFGLIETFKMSYLISLFISKKLKKNIFYQNISKKSSGEFKTFLL